MQAAKKGIYTDTTKTKKSQRTQKYPQYVIDMLWELRKEQDEQCAGIGDKWQDYDRLFIKWDGSPMNNNTPYFWFKEFCEKNSIRFCVIHSLRHPYVKHTTKNIILKSRKPKLPILVLIVWVFCFCFLFYDFARSIGGIISIISFKDYFCCSTAFFTAEI